MGKKSKIALANDEEAALAVSKPVTPLPMLQIFVVCSVQMAEAMNVELLFPFLAFMVEDMGYTGEQLGYHAGILAATFCGAQFCTSVAWGMISDRYGRRFAVVSGTLGAGIGMLIFGFAKTFPQAILGRIVGGLLCGNLGVVKSFLTEVTDDTNRSSAFYLFSLSWTAGAILAPLIGGLLCKPAEKYPAIFPSGPGSLWVEFPYLLPCLLTVGISVFGAVLCMIFMIETRGAKKDAYDSNMAVAGAQSELHGSEMDSLEEGVQMNRTDFHRIESTNVTDSSNDDEDVEHAIDSDSDDLADSVAMEPEEMCCPSVFEYVTEVCKWLSCTATTRTSDSNSNNNSIDSSTHGLMEPDSGSDVSTSSTTAATSTSSNSTEGGVSTASILAQRVVVLATMNYGMLCASCILIDETLPLYLKLERAHGGFGFDSAQIGTLLSTGAAGMTALSIVFMPLTNKMSNKRLSMISTALSVPFCLAFPLIALLNNHVLVHMHNSTARTFLLWSLLIVVNTLRNLCACLGFTAANIMVNHSVTNEHLGAVNGLSQSMGALARCLGPAVGGLLWSMATKYDFVYLNFIAVMVIFALNYYVSHLVPQ